MTVDGELRAVRAVARQLRQRTPDARTLGAWAASLESSVRGVERAVAFLRAEAAGRLPEVDGADYEGLTPEEAARRFASRAVALAVEGAPGVELLAERRRFTAAIAASAPPSSSRRHLASLPSADGDRAGKARTGARDTSRSAALAVLPKSGGQRRRVLDAVAAAARDPRYAGLTDVEMQRVTGLSPNSQRPRRVELVDGGWLEDSGQRRQHHGGEHAVWTLTARGAAEVSAGRLGA